MPAYDEDGVEIGARCLNAEDEWIGSETRGYAIVVAHEGASVLLDHVCGEAITKHIGVPATVMGLSEAKIVYGTHDKHSTRLVSGEHPPNGVYLGRLRFDGSEDEHGDFIITLYLIELQHVTKEQWHCILTGKRWL